MSRISLQFLSATMINFSIFIFLHFRVLYLYFLEFTINFPCSKSGLRIWVNDVISQKYYTGWNYNNNNNKIFRNGLENLITVALKIFFKSNFLGTWRTKILRKTRYHPPRYVPLRSRHSLSAVRYFSGGHSGRQLPVVLSIATRQTLHSVGNGFPDDCVLQPEMQRRT